MFLENLQEVADCPEAEGMWQNLAEIALQLHNLKVAERCYAALGDISRAHFLRVTLQIAEDYAKKNGTKNTPQLPRPQNTRFLNNEIIFRW